MCVTKEKGTGEWLSVLLPLLQEFVTDCFSCCTGHLCKRADASAYSRGSEGGVESSIAMILARGGLLLGQRLAGRVAVSIYVHAQPPSRAEQVR